MTTRIGRGIVCVALWTLPGLAWALEALEIPHWYDDLIILSNYGTDDATTLCADAGGEVRILCVPWMETTVTLMGETVSRDCTIRAVPSGMTQEAGEVELPWEGGIPFSTNACDVKILLSHRYHWDRLGGWNGYVNEPAVEITDGVTLTLEGVTLSLDRESEDVHRESDEDPEPWIVVEDGVLELSQVGVEFNPDKIPTLVGNGGSSTVTITNSYLTGDLAKGSSYPAIVAGDLDVTGSVFHVDSGQTAGVWLSGSGSVEHTFFFAASDSSEGAISPVVGNLWVDHVTLLDQSSSSSWYKGFEGAGLTPHHSALLSGKVDETTWLEDDQNVKSGLDADLFAPHGTSVRVGAPGLYFSLEDLAVWPEPCSALVRDDGDGSFSQIIGLLGGDLGDLPWAEAAYFADDDDDGWPDGADNDPDDEFNPSAGFYADNDGDDCYSPGPDDRVGRCEDGEDVKPISQSECMEDTGADSGMEDRDLDDSGDPTRPGSTGMTLRRWTCATGGPPSSAMGLFALVPLLLTRRRADRRRRG